MVRFKLLYRTDTHIRYEYFPCGETDSKAGIIEIDIMKEKIYVVQPAEKDIYRIISAMEQNKMRDSINEMRKENGESSISEEELPIETEDIRYYIYASHAMDKIAEAYDAGNVLDEGVVAWY